MAASRLALGRAPRWRRLSAGGRRDACRAWLAAHETVVDRKLSILQLGLQLAPPSLLRSPQTFQLHVSAHTTSTFECRQLACAAPCRIPDGNTEHTHHRDKTSPAEPNHTLAETAVTNPSPKTTCLRGRPDGAVNCATADPRSCRKLASLVGQMAGYCATLAGQAIG